MPLTMLDPTEDRNFAEGETIFDVDGNQYIVRGDQACLVRNQSRMSPLTDTRHCFSRLVPPVARCPGCGCTVFTNSDATTGYCSGCKAHHA